MLLVGKSSVDELVPSDFQEVKYNEIRDEEMWRVGLVDEITDVKFGDTTIEGFTMEELNTIMNFICTT